MKRRKQTEQKKKKKGINKENKTIKMTKILKKTKKEYKRKKNQYLIGHKILFDVIYSSVTLLKNRGRTALRSKHKKIRKKEEIQTHIL